MQAWLGGSRFGQRKFLASYESLLHRLMWPGSGARSTGKVLSSDSGAYWLHLAHLGIALISKASYSHTFAQNGYFFPPLTS